MSAFLNASSKKGSSLIDEMNRKVQKLKDDMNLVKEKIKAIDAENKAQQGWQNINKLTSKIFLFVKEKEILPQSWNQDFVYKTAGEILLSIK